MSYPLYKLFLKGKLCDVEIVAEGKSIRAHRLVLSAYSKYFYSLFNGDFVEKNIDVIVLEADYKTVFDVIYYMYTESIELHKRNNESIFSLAHYLQINPLIKKCAHEFNKIVNEESCIHLFKFSELYDLTELKRRTRWLMPSMVMNSRDQLRALDLEDLLLVLDQIRDNVDRSITLTAVTQWIQANTRRRIRYAVQLAKRIGDSPRTVSSRTVYKQYVMELQNHPEEFRPAYHNCIVFLGGSMKGYVKALNPETGKSVVLSKWWTIEHWEYFTAVCMDDVMYFVGGKIDTISTTNALAYDVKANVWFRIPNLPEHRNEATACALHGCIYLVGGYDADDRPLDTTRYWKPGYDRWYKGPTLVEPVAETSAVLYKSELWILGGRVLRNGVLDTTDVVQKLSGNEWVRVNELSVPKASVTAIVYRERLYCIGGLVDRYTSTNEVLRYRDDTNEWEYVGSTKHKRGGAVGCVFNDELYVFGGTNTYTSERYNGIAWKRSNDVSCYVASMNAAYATYLEL
ncbi:gp008R [Rabbit fibroma virus]|uniref:Gp008L n=1 Tax=Rabbit fibroma virus (strain Kasza) TaxID=10272 RepID=Q9PWW8_RFVKA|nr:gp008L [Rabbit fibroma virus]NP_052041.1 gp008R [Rabbit fibroma virus]AAF17891.1 gp008L [Rabbit fibroma virus]AAF18034.1 gp008R [Rabbit fibroma virus]